jgi:hydroxymethylglutaryl-CoA lyase
MQGIQAFIPTEKKIEYLQALLQVGFDVLDAGSFVSAKAIPQMQDTKEVLSSLSWQHSGTRLLAIVANTRGAEEALMLPGIAILGFPLSLSETFQQRNTNRSIAEAFLTIKEIQERCQHSARELVVYLSMGFGNPYGDPYAPGLVLEFVQRLKELGVTSVALADTIGLSTPLQVTELCRLLHQHLNDMSWGLHLHARPGEANEKIMAAYQAGCTRFDSAIGGIGGCPMAGDQLVGNVATETLLQCFPYKADLLKWDALAEAQAIARHIFNTYH